MKNTLEYINNLAENNPSLLVNDAEKDYTEELLKTAKIISDDDNILIVALAGPSASGKTTTAHILEKILDDMGEKTSVISLDDFYLPQNLLPYNEDGTKDIESVNSLDIKQIEICLNEIIKNGKTEIPQYDFTKHERSEKKKLIDIKDHGIVIVEGLHALNPIITDLVPKKNIYKIYISVNTKITDDNGNKILSSKQLRLVRRTLRDMDTRATDLKTTLKLWAGVVEGEEKYLYCYKDTADTMLKTLHSFEPSVYKDRFISLEKEIDADNSWYRYFNKTINALKLFKTIDCNLVPENSLIREFIGNLT